MVQIIESFRKTSIKSHTFSIKGCTLAGVGQYSFKVHNLYPSLPVEFYTVPEDVRERYIRVIERDRRQVRLISR